jgi:hypothetical protein
MKLHSMKMSKKEKKDSMPTAVSDTPDYPYGLRLSLNDEALKKLGIKSLPKVGSKMHVLAVGEITSVSQHESAGHEDRHVEIQLHELGVSDDGPKMEDTLLSEYRKLNK